MTFSIGLIEWDVLLVDGFVYIDNEAKLGGSDVVKQEIYISRIAKPTTRKIILWHEIAHAIKDTCDVYEREDMHIEAACNIAGLFPGFIGEFELCRLGYYVTTEQEARMVQFVADGTLIPID